jgi:hypothetical protein
LGRSTAAASKCRSALIPRRAAVASGRFIDSEDDQFDRSRSPENSRGFLPMPIITAEAAVRDGGGGASPFLLGGL